MAAHEYKSKIAQEFLGQLWSPGKFPSYFTLYDDLFEFDFGLSGCTNVLQQGGAEANLAGIIDHNAIVQAGRILKENPRLTFSAAKFELVKRLQGTFSTRDIELTLNLTVQAMVMVDPNIKNTHGRNYTIGSYRPTAWLPEESFEDFISDCFRGVSPERADRVSTALRDSWLLRASALKKRLGIVFKGTDNIAQHLICDFDRDRRVIYLFHHVAYMRAHLDIWGGETQVKSLTFKQSLSRGTLCPRLLAETLHSLQSILFCDNDEESMDLLHGLVSYEGFDEECRKHDGYRMFSMKDISYVYWGERLVRLYELVLQPPPRTSFQRWIRWNASDDNAFLVAMIALIISIIVSILSLGLSALQTWIAWQAWKHPV